MQSRGTGAPVRRLSAGSATTLWRWYEITLAVLALVFVALLVVQFTVSLSREAERWLNLAGIVIWAIFIADFLVRFALAPSKPVFLRAHWLSGLAVVLPFVRVFHVIRAVQLLTSVHAGSMAVGAQRGTSAVRHFLRANSAIYIGALTLLILLLSSAGMYSLEHDAGGANIRNFGSALWWCAGTLTTVGNDKDPVTGPGRTLAVLVMVYGLGLAGYITAQLATILLGQQQDSDAPIVALRDEVAALRRQLTDGTSAAPAPSDEREHAGEATADRDAGARSGDL